MILGKIIGRNQCPSMQIRLGEVQGIDWEQMGIWHAHFHDTFQRLLDNSKVFELLRSSQLLFFFFFKSFCFWKKECLKTFLGNYLYGLIKAAWIRKFLYSSVTSDHLKSIIYCSYQLRKVIMNHRYVHFILDFWVLYDGILHFYLMYVSHVNHQ